MSTILETRGLTHVYGAGTPFERVALDHVDIQINKGEILGVIGHTGSGKSTLIQHLNGLLQPSEGEVLLDGKSIWDAKGKCARETRFRVGLVFQYPEYQLFEETIAKDIAYGPTNMSLPQAEIDARVRESMEAVGLAPELADQSPFALSGGQKRRVAIAGVIAMRPDVLVLDEPTAGLDPAGRDEIFELVRNYHAQSGATILIVSHSMEDISQIADRLLVMDHARVLFCDTPREVFSHADEIVAAGLDIPMITKVMIELKKRGHDVDTYRCAGDGRAARLQEERGRSLMLKDITIGQFFPGNSAVHRLDPRVKIVLTVALIVLLFLAQGPVSYGLIILFLALVIGISRISPKMVVRGLKPILLIVMFTAVLNLFYTPGDYVWQWKFLHISVEGIRMAIFMVLRLMLLIIATSMLTYTTSPIQLTDGLGRLLSPLKKLHAPVHELSMMMSIALRFIPTLIEETEKIISAQKARGADFDSGNLIQRAKAMIPILVPLFISAFRRADELATAMECRLYRGDVGRTRMRQLKIARVDICSMLFVAVLFAAVIALRRLGL